ncbi:hypothetical protein FOG51_01049 [Hanseniaspora uvarum]|nr:hypothetical protein FOG51_01049 [Hanseniaspora uvarum]
MPKYLLQLSQCHLEFRIPELESLAELYNIDIDFKAVKYDANYPYLIIDLPNSESAKLLVQRSILTNGIYELFSEGPTYKEIFKNINKDFDELLLDEDFNKKSMKFQLHTSNKRSKYTMPEMVEIFNEFAVLNIKNKINLKSPEVIFQIFEHYKEVTDETPCTIYFTKLVQLSLRSKGILDKLRLNKRPYIGTTTFEPELSLVTCNLSLVKPFKFVYDPFCGTGGFLTAAATIEKNTLVLGSDMDGRMLRGNSSKSSTSEHLNNRKNKTPNEVGLEEHIQNLKISKNVQGIALNFEYYKQSHQLVSLLTMDFTHNALRSNLSIDSIMCDPPYGIREGIKVLGSDNQDIINNSKHSMKDGKLAYLHEDYIASKKQYSLDELIIDILKFAQARLPKNGRLAFWVPTKDKRGLDTLVLDEYDDMKLLYNCSQDFNQWSRRVLVYKKV